MSSELSGSRGSVDAEDSWLSHPVTLHGAKWMFCSYVSGHCPDEENKNKSTSLKRTSKQLADTGRGQITLLKTRTNTYQNVAHYDHTRTL